MKTNRNIPSRGDTLRQVGLAMTIPMALLAGPLVGWFIGNFLEKKFTLPHYVTVFFIIFGFIAGIRHAWRLIKQISQDDK